MSTPTVIHGAIAVIEQDGRLLVIRRAASILAGGTWCFPGGAIEPRESVEEAVRREVLEEVGLHVQPVRQAWTWQRPDGGLILHWWEARLDPPGQEPTANPAEVAECRWVRPVEFEGLSPVLDSNLAFLRAWRNRRGHDRSG